MADSHLHWNGAVRRRRAFRQRHPHSAHALARRAEIGPNGRRAPAGGLDELRRFQEAAVVRFRDGVHQGVGVHPHPRRERA